MLRQLLAITAKDFKKILRNKQQLLFIFLFPLVFLLIFGTVFGGEGARASVEIGVVNLDREPVIIDGKRYRRNNIAEIFVEGLKDVNFTVTEYREIGDIHLTRDSGLWALQEGDISGLLVIPANFSECLGFVYTEAGHPVLQQPRLIVYIDQSDPNNALITEGTITGFVAGFGQIYGGTVAQALSSDELAVVTFVGHPIEARTISREKKVLKNIDFLVPGMITIVLVWVGLSHSVDSIAREKDEGSFQRLIIAPLSPIVILGGKAIYAIIIVLVSSAVALLTGVLFFDVDPHWNLHLTIPLIVLGSLAVIGAGLIITSLAKDSQTAETITLFVQFPIQFFVGVFIPVSLLPGPAQRVAELLPFTRVTSALQAIMTRDLGLNAIMGDALYLAGSSLVFFVLGVLAYDWSLKQL